MKGLIVAAAAMLVLGVGTAYAVMEPVALIGVSRDALASSLDDQLAKGDSRYTWDTRCNPLDGEMWRCVVPTSDSEFSGRRFELRVDDDGCWEAGEWRPAGNSTPTNSLTSGCIGFLDATGLSAN